jgi:hypothetical protein
MLGPYRTPGFAQIRQLRNSASPGLPLPDLSTVLGKYLRAFTNAGIFGMVIISVLAIFLIAALTAPVANLTTGITIAHTGFTPNPNITGTPGLSPILQVYPLFFVFIGLIFLAKHFGEESRGI